MTFLDSLIPIAHLHFLLHQLLFCCSETGSHYVAQPGLELNSPPAAMIVYRLFHSICSQDFLVLVLSHWFQIPTGVGRKSEC